MRIGVVIPARAPVPYLDAALASVLAQEPAPDAVVLVDHASEPPLAARPGAQLVRVDDPEGGPAAARAAGAAVLDCDWIALADADDAWEPGKLAAQVEAARAHPSAAVCFGRARVIDADGRPSGERLPELEPGLHAAEALRPRLFERNPVPAASAMVRRDALQAVGGFAGGPPLPAGSDWELWLRLVRAGYAFVCEPRARIAYRRHTAGLTADVSRLAEAGLAIHAEHADLVDPALARRMRAHDLKALARGRVRERRYADARGALEAAAALEPPRPRERALALALRVPGLRLALGRRDPY